MKLKILTFECFVTIKYTIITIDYDDDDDDGDDDGELFLCHG